MTTISIVENKISSVKKYLKILENYRKLSIKEILNSVDKKGAVERYLYLAAQATIDLAEAFISYKKYRKPTTLSEAFYILEENKIIKNDLREKMVGMVGFRNVVSHDYDKIDYEIVEEVLRSGLDDVEEFVGIIEDKI